MKVTMTKRELIKALEAMSIDDDAPVLFNAGNFFQPDYRRIKEGSIGHPLKEDLEPDEQFERVLHLILA